MDRRQGKKIVQLQKQFTTDKLNVQLQNTWYNSYFICTSAKLYIGLVHSFSTSAKEKKHNCKIHGTNAKQIVQLQKKMHNGDFPLPSQ